MDENRIEVYRINGYIRQRRTIADMRVGEVGYAIPWAFDLETNTLDGAATILEKPFGTGTMKVTLTEDGYVIEPGDYEY
jgi:hypothetical protein